MINEAIQFIKKYKEEDEGSSNRPLDYKINQIKQKYPKIIIINTSFNENEINYQGFTFLLSENPSDNLRDKIDFGDMNQWLSENEQIIKKLDFGHYISPMMNLNKCIGSRSGLLSFSLFHFRIIRDWFSYDDKWRFNFAKKIEKFKFNRDDLKQFKQDLDEKQYAQIKFLNGEEGIKEIYSEFSNDILQKFDLDKKTIKEYRKNDLSEADLNSLSSRKKEIKEKVEGIRDLFDNTYVYINIDNLLISEDELLESSLLSKIFLTKETIKNGDVCPICNKENVKTGVPSSYNVLNKVKPFLVHKDKGDGYNLRVCLDCAINFNNFQQFLKKYRFDFFPLFVKDEFETEEIKYLKNRSDGELTFFGILKHILNNSRKDELDFILLHYKGDILYYDYINNYHFKLGKYGSYLNNESSYKLNLKNLMGKFDDRTILGLKPYNIFHDLRRGVETYRKYLIYKYRQKIFDLIYRSNWTLTGRDIAEIVTVQLEKRIRNDESNWPTQV